MAERDIRDSTELGGLILARANVRLRCGVRGVVAGGRALLSDLLAGRRGVRFLFLVGGVLDKLRGTGWGKEEWM